VKATFRILGVIFLAAIYCFAIAVVPKTVLYSGFQGSLNAEKEGYFTAVSTTLYSHTAPSESKVNHVNNLPAPSFKNPFDELWTNVKASERLLVSGFSQYINFSTNFLILYRKADVIFPFHYFW
jgi:capsule polysaccharide modification protein KpsS